MGARCFAALKAEEEARGAKYFALNTHCRRSMRFWERLGFWQDGFDEHGSALMVLPPRAEGDLTAGGGHAVKIGAYQFPASGDISENLRFMRKAVDLAKAEGVRLLAFCECALTGYPPEKAQSAAAVDFEALDRALSELRDLASSSGMYLLTGSVTKRDGRYYNSALLFEPGGGAPQCYDKRALWGWGPGQLRPRFGRRSFGRSTGTGSACASATRCGFRNTFGNCTVKRWTSRPRSFCYVSKTDDADCYELIRSHVRTRASELTCPLLSVNDISPFQTAPTGGLRRRRNSGPGARKGPRGAFGVRF